MNKRHSIGMYYILDENNQVIPATMDDYILFSKDPKSKIIAQENVTETGGEFWVSTVFLGVDHSFGGDNTPVVFETMIFGADDHCERYETYEQARVGHADIIDRLLDGWDPRLND